MADVRVRLLGPVGVGVDGRAAELGAQLRLMARRRALRWRSSLSLEAPEAMDVERLLSSTTS